MQLGSHFRRRFGCFFQLHRQQGSRFACAAEHRLRRNALPHQHGHQVFKIGGRTGQLVAQARRQFVYRLILRRNLPRFIHHCHAQIGAGGFGFGIGFYRHHQRAPDARSS